MTFSPELRGSFCHWVGSMPGAGPTQAWSRTSRLLLWKEFKNDMKNE